MINQTNRARERAKIRKFQTAVWDGNMHPNSKIELAVALGMHPAELAKWMKLPGAPVYRVGNRTGGYDLRAFQQFIAARKAGFRS